MDLDEQRAIARNFYEENRESLLEAVLDDYRKNFEATIERIARVQIGEFDPFEVEIERSNQPLPQTVSDAFERHLWYSQWNFADLYLVKILIDDQPFFFLFHSGFADDGWDSSDTKKMEIFIKDGSFIGAIDCFSGESEKWRESPFNHDDFCGVTGQPTPWPTQNPPDLNNGGPLWTEERMRQEGATIEQDGNVTRYVRFWD